MATRVSESKILRLTRLELASSGVWGQVPAEAWPSPRDGPPPLEALQGAVTSALEKAPCLVSFSGGRDSSIVLAVAARVARRNGLPLPVPVSLRFPGAARAEESSWQERVIRRLGLEDWIRLQFADELDWIGPISRRCMLEHGVGYPPNAHLHLPLAEHASGGSLLTGFGGDDLFEWRWGRAFGVLAGRARPEPRDLLRIAHLASPWVFRRRRYEQLVGQWLPPWLREKAQEQLLTAMLEQGRLAPRRWNRWLAWLARTRYLELARQTLAQVAAMGGSTIAHPLLDSGFLASLARRGGAAGWLNRTHALTALFSDVLPRDILARSSKALFDEPLWGPHSRAFIERWDGSGVDRELVDVDALRAEWRKPEPYASTAMLLQSAWLATEGKQLAPQVAAPAT